MADVRRAIWALCMGGLVTTAVASGCAAGNEKDMGNVGGLGDGGIDPGDGAIGNDGLSVPGSDGGGNRCSDDLHSVLDASGLVIETCDSGDGCADGKCISACDAAGKNKGNVGCDFRVPTPMFFPGDKQPCFAVFVANNWAKDVKLKVEYNGVTYDPTTFARIPNGTNDAKSWGKLPASGLAVGQVAVLFLSSDPAAEHAGIPLNCPVTPMLGNATERTSTGRLRSFHIQSDFPVSAYDIIPFGGARSFLPGSTMVLPTTAWGKNYVLVMPFVYEVPFLGGQGGPVYSQIVAAQNDTVVEVRPKWDMAPGDGVDEAKAGVVTKYTLQAGEAIQWSNLSQKHPGSVLLSNKPIGFIGGNGEMCMPSLTSPSGGGCDSSHQQVPPVSALGFDYAVAPYTTRRKDMKEESIPYRIVGAVDGTELTYDPEPPDLGKKTESMYDLFGHPPKVINAGDMVDFQITGPFRLKSKDKAHPFYLAQNMSGGLVEGGPRSGETPGGVPGMDLPPGLGDEEVVSVLPPDQFQSSYVFFTDPTYGTTNLVLTRVKGAKGFQDVSVDCVGAVTGWKPIGSSGQAEYANVDLLRAAAGPCKNGQHSAKSEGRFGLVVWGLDTWASYAYPAGASVAPINDVVVPVIK